jgi:ankyrin repeat protein
MSVLKGKISRHVSPRFRWVFCQLETLRRSVQPNLRVILEKLPKTLDETYERVLKDINEENTKHARRLLHCLAVAIRPLHVEELAEILMFNFDDVQGGIPKFHAGRRRKGQEEAVLSICSSMIAVVDRAGSRVVQFSHFSVKEFLMSDRLASSTLDVSRYHILPGLAHTILAQACLGFLLHLDDRIDTKSAMGFPLAKYAAEHWVAHAQFGDVASRVKDGMRSLFDPDKRHLVAWLRIHNIDPYGSGEPSDPNPLYYASLCGFHDLVEHIVINHPRLVNTVSNSVGSPLFAALSGKHIRVAEFLLRHGGNVDVRGKYGQTTLLVATKIGDVPVVSFLLQHGADVNSQNDGLQTPLHEMSWSPDKLEIAQMLLEHGADINSRNHNGEIPLHRLLNADLYGDAYLPLVQLFLEHGTNVNAQDKDHTTPLHIAMKLWLHKTARVFLEHGAEPNVKDNNGKTPLHLLLDLEVWIEDRDDNILGSVQLLLERGANVNVQDKGHTTPLHLAIKWGLHAIMRFFLEHGAEHSVMDGDGKTPLHLLLESEMDEDEPLSSVQLLLEHGANVNAQDKNHTSPLHIAMKLWLHKTARVFLEHGAEPNVKDNNGKTPLHLLLDLEERIEDHDDNILGSVQLLLERGANVNVQDKGHTTPLHLAIKWGLHAIMRLFLEHGAEHSVMDGDGKTPLHLVLDLELEINNFTRNLNEDILKARATRLLLERGADVNAQDKDHTTPLLLAIQRNLYDIARILLIRGADPSVKNQNGETPLHLVLLEGDFTDEDDIPGLVRLLLDRGADVNALDQNYATPLWLAAERVMVVNPLILNRNVRPSVKNEGKTPLYLVSNHPQKVEIAPIIIEHAAADQDRALLHMSLEGKYNSKEHILIVSRFHLNAPQT